jgi:hypothetical protein
MSNRLRKSLSYTSRTIIHSYLVSNIMTAFEPSNVYQKKLQEDLTKHELLMKKHEDYLLSELDQHLIKKQKLNEENRMNNSMISDIEAALALLPSRNIICKVNTKVTKKQKVIQHVRDLDAIPLPIPYIPKSPIIESTIVDNIMNVDMEHDIKEESNSNSNINADINYVINDKDNISSDSNSNGIEIIGNNRSVEIESPVKVVTILSNSTNNISGDDGNNDNNAGVPEKAVEDHVGT